jgi:DNA topoisomerase I
MSYKLLIVESPAKAKTIEKYLKDIGNYKVVASIGHIRDLPKSNKKAIDIAKGFVPHYEVSPGKEKVIEGIKSLVKKADEVLLATDPDREGEAIAWHLKEVLKLKNPKRVVFHEITKDAIQNAVTHPRHIDDNLKQAQEARRVLDRLVGYDLSGIIWKKVRYGLSAGRVQSPALRIIMERERQIRAFIPETYWVIDAIFDDLKKNKIPAVCEVEPRDEKEVKTILEKADKEDWSIVDVKKTQAKRAPKPPFTTSTLQQAASTRLGYSPSKTMMMAQKLYEAGHITYMRTDSTNLSAQAITEIQKFVTSEFGANYVQTRAYGKKSKNAQEAHEAVRPTNMSAKSKGMTDDQKRLYDLIWRRTIASQMIDAQIMRTKISFNITSKSIPNFVSNGQIIMKDGWLLIDPKAKNEEVTLPEVTEGQKVKLDEIKDEKKETQPPGRYSEAGLVKELEKRGIGRPSTYASIIKTLLDREYVTKEGKALVPSDTGDVVSSFLEDNFATYIGDTFTADMENQLDEIAEGTKEYKKTLKDFYTVFKKEVDSKESLDKATTLGHSDEFKCPKCGAGMDIKLGRGGKFLSCERYPECDGALMINGTEIKKDEPLGTYPETGEPVFLLTGRFGPYVQVGEKTKENKKPKRASIPKNVAIETIDLKDALKFLSLPRVLGNHPETGEPISANNGRFGPYVVHESDFRSLKTDDVYTIDLKRALEIFAEEKKVGRRGGFKKKEK